MWEKKYKAAQQGMEELANKLNETVSLNETLVAEKKQWEQEKVVQQQIIAQQLGNNDSVVQQLQNEIREIKRKYNIKD